jgi:CheY-like chemotaxis protein
MARTVLIVDDSVHFRNFLREKLIEHGIGAIAAAGGLDAVAKLRAEIPSLVLIDIDLKGRVDASGFLEERAKNPNTASIPFIAIGSKASLAALPDHAKPLRFLEKPLRIGELYLALAEALGVAIEVDRVESSIEAAYNDGLLFIEVARGLNRDKIDLLGLKLHELIDLYDIASPKALLVVSDLGLSFVDGPNIELLLGTVLRALSNKPKALKVLTKEVFLKDFIAGRKEYALIECFESLQDALDDLLKESPEDMGAKKAVDFVSGQKGGGSAESVVIGFDAMKLREKMEGLAEEGSAAAVAVVDDDMIIRELIRTAFQEMSIEVQAFSNGKEFLEAAKRRRFSLVFLDILMPEMNGFEVLQRLNALESKTPVIVLSALSRKEAVMKAVQLGVRSYMIKPIKPDAIYRKAIEVLRPSF